MDFKKYPRSSTSNFTPLAFRNKDLAHSTIFTSKPLVLVLIESRHKKRPLLEDCSSSQGSRLNGNTGIPFKFLTYSSMPRRFRKFSVQCLRKLSLCIWDLALLYIIQFNVGDLVLLYIISKHVELSSIDLIIETRAVFNQNIAKDIGISTITFKQPHTLWKQ